MADVSADLEAARRAYNDLHPDRPIKRVGDTPQASYFLVGLSVSWLNGIPLNEDEIAAVEMMTPAGMLS
jgi:hypothetical protein